MRSTQSDGNGAPWHPIMASQWFMPRLNILFNLVNQDQKLRMIMPDRAMVIPSMATKPKGLLNNKERNHPNQAKWCRQKTINARHTTFN